jgi:hypothetical protein
MRRALAAAAVIAALSGSPAVAQNAAGYLGIFGGGGFSMLGRVGVVGLDGAAAFQLGPAIVQLETRGAAFFTTPVASTIEAGLVHAYRRNAASAFGGYFGVEPTTFPGVVTSTWHFGAEAQFYTQNMTYYAQAAYLRINEGGTIDPGWYVRFAARYFPRENLRLQADLRYLVVTGLATQWTVAGTAEFQLPGRPISLLGTLRRTTISGNPVNAVLLGLRVNFGTGTLADQGAPMETLPITF